MKNFKILNDFELCAAEAQVEASIAYAVTNMKYDEHLNDLYSELEDIHQEKKKRGLEDGSSK